MRWLVGLFRTLVACLIAPPVAATIVLLLFPIAGLAPVTAARILFIGAMVVAAVMTVIGGVPMHLVLRSSSEDQKWRYATAGALLGLAPFALYAIVAVLKALTRASAGESTSPGFPGRI